VTTLAVPLLHRDQLALCGLLPHPPVAIPAIGRDQAARCLATTRACERFAERLVGSRPARLVLVSPHAPRHRHAFGLTSCERLRGDLAELAEPGVAVDLPCDPALVDRLEREAEQQGLACWRFSGATLDHGSVVPLSFLAGAGWNGPTTVISLPWSPPASEITAFGRALAHAAQQVDGPVALVASGDMSHRVLPGAPAGFHPRAAAFDQRVRELIEAGALESLPSLDARWRGQAAEDVLDTAALVIAALPEELRGTRVLSYEHPFGVGYLVAIFHEGSATPQRAT
jgi:aromatic ring-opening dioxygenase LigB subunit